jgi:ABC-2 type transport system permease protein
MSELQNNLSAMLAGTRMRLIYVSRYPGQLASEAIIPIVFAAMPILLGRASGGPNAEAIFEANTGTANYVAYMLIGSSVFSIVSNAFWHVSYWLRRELQLGTLESLYLVPTGRLWIVGSAALYSAVRSVTSAMIAYLIGSVIFRVNPFQGEVGLALLFILVGLIPLYGLTFLFGALVLKVKEAGGIINLMQWVVSFLMGIFFPVVMFPPLLKLAALAFPPTWMTNGVRSALLGLGFFFGEWYWDLAMLWAFLLIAPMVGVWVFRRAEASVQRNEGVGQF